jgi:hypothetical protein
VLKVTLNTINQPTKYFLTFNLTWNINFENSRIIVISFTDKNSHVMFYTVIRNKHLIFNVDAILVFETVIVNEGEHYDPYDGVFVAPQKAVYLFSWTVSGISSNYIVTELVVEQNTISSAGEQNGGGHPSGSMTALCKKGDHAWIRTTVVSTGHQLYSHDNVPQSSFLGLLIDIMS